MPHWRFIKRVEIGTVCRVRLWPETILIWPNDRLLLSLPSDQPLPSQLDPELAIFMRRLYLSQAGKVVVSVAVVGVAIVNVFDFVVVVDEVAIFVILALVALVVLCVLVIVLFVLVVLVVAAAASTRRRVLAHSTQEPRR